jgi:SPP1 family predicted phage head-tail adaptor
MQAGDLRDRLQFQKRGAVADDYGSVSGDWSAQFTRAAAIKVPDQGREAVIAARLQGTQPVEIIVRYDDLTATITPEWRAVDTRDGKTYAIRTAGDMDRRRQWITLMAQVGVAE